MINQFLKSRKTLILLLFIMLTQGCVRARFAASSGLPTARDIESTSTQNVESRSTPTRQFTQTPSPTATVVIPTETALPKVTITAMMGNLFIRRGPGLPYNQIGVLHKGSSADVIASDVLSEWVQIIIPDSNKTGWVSIQTEYSKLNGLRNGLWLHTSIIAQNMICIFSRARSFLLHILLIQIMKSS